MPPFLAVEKIKNLKNLSKNRAKRARKVFAKPFSKRLAGGKGTESPNTCSKIFSTNRVYRQAETAAFLPPFFILLYSS